MSGVPKPPKVPCGTCPYRRDVPAGLWHQDEYAKLPGYDAETPFQPTALFLCHQRDGCLCGGWLLAHDRHHLLALRMHQVHPSVWSYDPGVEVFASGAEAAAHGMSGIEAPSAAAQKKIIGLLRQKSRRRFDSTPVYANRGE